jgi:hypothetical protein
MNVATITMPPDLAREKLRAYRAAKHKDAEEQYRQCEEGYKALAAGTPLLNLDDVFRDVALDEKCRPKVAIARADQRQVYFQWDGGSTTALFDTARLHPNAVWHASYRINVNMSREHGRTRREGPSQWFPNGRDAAVSVTGYAMIPMVPADVRPEHGLLKERFILWEVDHWADQKIGARPPRDPFLLKHIGGALYAVLAEWDLTDLERAILGGAMRSR